METVSADSVLLVILIWKGIHICVCRHCLMEGSIEHTDLRYSRKHCRNSLDTKNVCRIMKRCEYRTFFELGNDLVSDELAAYELLRAMNDTVTYSFDIFKSCEDAILLVEESIKNSLDTYGMILDRHFLYKLLLTCCLMLEATDFHSDSLDKTLGEKIINFIALHIKKLILQRRTSTV